MMTLGSTLGDDSAGPHECHPRPARRRPPPPRPPASHLWLRRVVLIVLAALAVAARAEDVKIMVLITDPNPSIFVYCSVFPTS